MRWAALILVVAGGATAGASEPPQKSPTVAVVGFGRCSEPLLAEATRALRREVEARAPGSVITEERVGELVGEPAKLSVEEVRRAIDSGKTDFLNMNVDRAQQTLEAVLLDVDRLPLGPQRWEAYVAARANLARVLQYKKDRRVTQIWLEVLRLKEDIALDRAEFPPSTREQLEQARSLLPAVGKARLKVLSEAAGAKVFLNGFLVGETPFEKDLPPWTYEVVVGDAAQHSFVRKVPLVGPMTVQVNVEREARLHAAQGPCYETAAGRDEVLRLIPQLAAPLGADKVIRVGLEKLDDGEYVTAGLVDVARGQEVRFGKDRLKGAGLPPMHKLAELVLSDKPPAVVAEPQKKAEIVAVRSELAVKPAPAPEAVPPPAVTPPDGAAPSGIRPTRIAAFVIGGAALVLGGVAAVKHFQAASAQGELDGLRGPTGINEKNLDHAAELRQQVAADQSLRNGLAIGAGAAAVGSGVLFVISSGADAKPATAGHPTLSLGVVLAGNF